MREVLIGFVSLVVGALVRPLIDRYLPRPGRIERVRRELDRMGDDHERWLESQQAAMIDALAAVANEMSERGVVASSFHVTRRRSVEEEYKQAESERVIELNRRIEDLLAQVSPWERGRLKNDSARARRRVGSSTGLDVDA